MTFGEKLYYTFNMIIMRPMLRDDPKSTDESARKMFWQALKDIWTNKLDEQFKQQGRYNN